MEIIEKQTIKEVPVDGNYGYGYGRKDINGKANAGLTLGIIGIALGAWALFGNRRSSVIGGLGTSGSGMLDGANININGLSTAGNGITSPSAFQAWEKGCEDTLALQKGLYDWALVQQSQRFADRQTIDSELFGLYKSQVDADFVRNCGIISRKTNYKGQVILPFIFFLLILSINNLLILLI